MKEFVINDHLNLRLENGKTNIYVNDKKILQCKYILIDIPIDTVNDDEFESIDEYIDEYKKAEAMTKERAKKLPPDVEFWGHCSNLHYWYLQHYDTNIIHHELAFPLLKALTKAGDSVAKTRFKEEIAKRFGSGYPSVMKFLEKEGYLEYLNEDELLLCVKDALENSLKKSNSQTVDWLIRNYGYRIENRFGREEYLHILLNKNDAEIIIELGKIIGKDIIIEEYIFNRQFISTFPEEYRERPPKRSAFTEYAIFIKDKAVSRLNLSECDLNSFPEIIKGLTNLNDLCLNGNNLKIISETILYLRNLKYLALAMCGIQDIPKWFEKLKNIEETNLAGNPLNEKSRGFIKNLKNIDFDF